MIWVIFRLAMLWLGLSTSVVVLAQETTEYKTYKRKKYSLADSLRGALRFERSCYDVHYYHLALEIIPQKKKIKGSNEIHFVVQQTTKKIQIDLFANMKIDKILFGDQALRFERKFNAVFVHFSDSLPVHSHHKIQVWYEGSPLLPSQTGGRHGFYWDTDQQGRPWVGLSCEGLGASFWFPNKDHLSDEPDSMRMSYTFPADLECIANGILEKQASPNEKQKTYHWLTKHPINNYNVTLYLGHYASIVLPYNPKGRQQRSIYAYFLDYERERAGAYFAKTPQFIRLFEDLFGEYPFWDEKMAIVQSPYPGMEHQTCVAIGPDLAIGQDESWAYGNQLPWARVLPHELAHEWWGNAVSAKDMADIWLHEGFATYAEMLLIEVALGKDAYLREIEKQENLIQYLYPILGNPHVNEDMFANNDVYHRGALILHELRIEIGDIRVFMGVMKRFFLENQFKTVTTQDFVQTVNAMTNRDFTKFLHDRLYIKRRVVSKK
jgi:aminopeptidase N